MLEPTGRREGGLFGRRRHEEGNPTCTATHTPSCDKTIDDAVQERRGAIRFQIASPYESPRTPHHRKPQYGLAFMGPRTHHILLTFWLVKRPTSPVPKNTPHAVLAGLYASCVAAQVPRRDST